jgi:hypothetical protein
MCIATIGNSVMAITAARAVARLYLHKAKWSRAMPIDRELEGRDELTMGEIDRIVGELTSDELAHVSGGITIKQKVAE